MLLFMMSLRSIDVVTYAHEDDGELVVCMGDIYGHEDGDVHHNLTEVLDQIENKHSSLLAPQSLYEEDSINSDENVDLDCLDIDMGGIYDNVDDADYFSQSAIDAEPPFASTNSDACSEAVKRSFRSAPCGSSSNLLAFPSQLYNVSSRSPSHIVNSQWPHQIKEVSAKNQGDLKRGHLNVLTQSSSMSDIMSPLSSTSSNASSATSRLYSLEGTNSLARKSQVAIIPTNLMQKNISDTSITNSNGGNSLFPATYAAMITDVASNDSDILKFDIPVRDRFFHAKREQERIEKERMNKLRSKITPHNFPQVRDCYFSCQLIVSLQMNLRLAVYGRMPSPV